ncbi:MAG: metallophosphoesterase [Microgenomates group bacterium]
MKTVIISDVHLTHRFDERKFLFLKELFSSCDRVILNGDFWDGYTTTFNRFITSPWRKLFPLLRQKKAVYLYGNHDQKIFSDKRTSLFSVSQKDVYKIRSNNETYHIEHGHVLCPSIDMIFPISRGSLYYINAAFQRLEKIFSFLKNPHNVILRYQNLKTKKKLRKTHFSPWYLCGHTHYAEIDTKNRFANSGYVQFGKASYLIVDSSGLSLHTKKYR